MGGAGYSGVVCYGREAVWRGRRFAVQRMATKRRGGQMKVEELLLGSDLLPCSARTGRAARRLHLATVCLCWETKSVCRRQRRRSNIKPTAATLVTGSVMTSLKVTRGRPKARSSGDVQRSTDTPLTWASAVCTLGLRGRHRFGCRNHRLRSAPRGSWAPAPPP